MKFLSTGMVIVVLMTIIANESLPTKLSDESSVVAGGDCNNVPSPTGCPAPNILGGQQLAALCNALQEQKPVGGWPLQWLTVDPGDNCSNKKVGNPPVFNCGDRVLITDDCTPNINWVPIF
jgi:hypothetical protein